jgi:peptidoglycan/LPS O-acetylase OafA/YrhL
LAVSKHDFVTLDGLRGIAAIAIVTRHCPVFWQSVSILGQLPEFGPLFESYLAVDFFFVLSGFVLMHAYAQKLREGMSTWHFMLVRLIRLYPLYFLALVLALLPSAWAALHSRLDGVSTSYLAIDAAFAILMLPSPFGGALFPLNTPAWSLFFELLANIVLALNGRNLTMKRLSVIVAGSALLLYCAVVMQWFGFGMAGQGAMSDGFYWSSFGAGLLRVLFSFFAGALMYRVWQKWPNRLHMHPVLISAILIVLLAAHPPVFLSARTTLQSQSSFFPFLY